MKILFVSVLFILSCSANKDATKISDNFSDTIPKCIADLIDNFKKQETRNPPVKIYSYTYKSKTVYYIPPECCDFYSYLYNDSCELIGYPDGGFTGRGDGSAPDFISTRINEKLIWQQKKN